MKPLTVLGLLAISTASAFADVSVRYSCDNGGVVSGLYDGSGISLTNACSIDSLDYWLTYRTEPGQAIYSPSWRTKTYRSRIVVHFTSAEWQSYPTTAFGVKVMNFAAVDSAALEQIKGDVADGVSSAKIKAATSDANPPEESSRAFSDVKPKKILVSALTVDPRDPSGKSGYIEFDSPAATGTEWWTSAIPSGRTGPWFSAVWLFPQWGASGLFTRREIETYPVERIRP